MASWHSAGVDRILFSVPYRTGLEESYLAEVLRSTVWHGDGRFTARATEWLRTQTGATSALLTTSGTHALELAALLLDLGPGDEVICPSFTFSSTAAAIAVRGAVPVFVDVQPDTLNVDPEAVVPAITPRTKAIFVVHYAGVAADLDVILPLAEQYGLAVVEDAAHSLGAYLRGQHLGTFGTFGAQSWHDTKNVTSGEGGAILINDERYVERAEIIREKGTNRSSFSRGLVDKYTWVDQGSSFLPSEFAAALLLAQFERFDDIQARRQAIWQTYDEQLVEWSERSEVRRMVVPPQRAQPAHMYYLMMPSPIDQKGIISHLDDRGIVATFHYQSLHDSPAGRRLGRAPLPCPVSRQASSTLVRLPLHAGMTSSDAERVVEAVRSYSPV